MSSPPTKETSTALSPLPGGSRKIALFQVNRLRSVRTIRRV